MVFIAVSMLLFISMIIVTLRMRGWISRLTVALRSNWCWLLHRHNSGALDNFVQLPPVQPYPSTLWAVVNFYALAIIHQQISGRAYGAFHGVYSLRVM